VPKSKPFARRGKHIIPTRLSHCRHSRIVAGDVSPLHTYRPETYQRQRCIAAISVSSQRCIAAMDISSPESIVTKDVPPSWTYRRRRQRRIAAARDVSPPETYRRCIRIAPRHIIARDVSPQLPYRRQRCFAAMDISSPEMYRRNCRIVARDVSPPWTYHRQRCIVSSPKTYRRHIISDLSRFNSNSMHLILDPR